MFRAGPVFQVCAPLLPLLLMVLTMERDSASCLKCLGIVALICGAMLTDESSIRPCFPVLFFVVSCAWGCLRPAVLHASNLPFWLLSTWIFRWLLMKEW